MSVLEEKRRLLKLANRHLGIDTYLEVFKRADAAFSAGLKGETIHEREERAFEASNEVWRKALRDAGVDA